MDKVLCWNIRGLNNNNKQYDVKHYIHKFAFGVVSLLKTKIKAKNLGLLYHKVFRGWCFTSNSSKHDGGRIVLAWKPGSFQVTISKVTPQMILCYLQPLSGRQGFYSTFIYAFNERARRMYLWEDIKSLHIVDPWILCGDFNCIMNNEERIGSQVREIEMRDMRECMTFYTMEDVKSSGNFFTWNNKQQGMARVFSKLDRVLANVA